jgi:hypothetical protein
VAVGQPANPGLKRFGDDYAAFWAAATKVAVFVAICLATLLLIIVRSSAGATAKPYCRDFLFD